MDDLVVLDLTPQQKIEFLKTFTWIKDLSDTQTEQFAGYLQAYEAATGTIIMSQGTRNEFLGFICEGEINIVKESTAGDGKMITGYKAGSVLGTISFFDQGLVSANAIVHEFATMLIIDRKRFNAFCSEVPDAALLVSLFFNKMLSQNLRDTSSRLAEAS
jgi:CRP/FNR family cyclic AMP-dependent transcriptional regulator